MLKIENLNYTISSKEGEKNILKNINFTFEKGKIYVITGANGSGKSTLVKTVMGINIPSSGKIYLNDEDITFLPINERAKKGLTYAFQKPTTFKGLKVRQLLDIASGEENSFGRSCEFLSKVGLCAREYIDRPLDDKLSGGEIKRIELAMALARKGKINIFDEPEAGIDLWSFDRLTEIFSSLKDSTTIIVSHQRKILEIADEIILLTDGEIERVGKYSEILPLLEKSSCQRLKNED